MNMSFFGDTMKRFVLSKAFGRFLNCAMWAAVLCTLFLYGRVVYAVNQ